MNRPALDQLVTFFYTADLPATAAFYEEVLQLPLVLDQGVCRIYRVSESGFIGFCTQVTAVGAGQTSPQLRGAIITLVSRDVDGWYTFLRQHNIAIEKPPTLNEKFNIYHLFVRDPNGYLVEIQTFLEETWPTPK